MKIRWKTKKGKWLLAAAAFLLLWLLLPARKHRMEVIVERPDRRDLTELIPASGTIRPVVEVRITPDVSGEVVELFVREGDAVKAGDLLLKIRQDLYLSQVEQAGASLGSLRAQCARQRAEVRQARLNHERDRKLYELNAVSAAEYQASKTELEVAESGLRAAEFAIRSGEAQLKEARENLLKTTLYAPISGTVSRIGVEKGERVVGTSQMAGTELLRIADFSRMEVGVEVGESDIVRIESGDSVQVEVDAYPGRSFRGWVTQIANSAKNLDERFNQVTNFAVRIELLPDSVKFLPGMSAAVSIVTDERRNCLTLPVESLFTRNKETFVWTVGPGNTAEARKVVTGIQQRDRIEIRSGLSDEDLVVTGPPGTVTKALTEGQRLRVSERKSKTS
ncbi:MAG: efflux RND transporter periplasmic adaptor subunit [Bacteroidales bacterium]|nr:efflux RND transporter periplasmic adaptor subunit [Bacteroidales bacterium]